MTSAHRLTFTVSEAADVLGISRSLAYELVRTGDLPHLRLGGRIVVPRVALRQLIGDNQTDGTQTTDRAVS